MALDAYLSDATADIDKMTMTMLTPTPFRTTIICPEALYTICLGGTFSFRPDIEVWLEENKMTARWECQTDQIVIIFDNYDDRFLFSLKYC